MWSLDNTEPQTQEKMDVVVPTFEGQDKKGKTLKIDANGDSELLLEELGKKLNLKKKGNLIDTERTARQIIKDFQEGKIK